MNLVQIQERLKDLPTQAIMSYANGQNPQVPPYLALGELNRRKQMEQQSAQPPQGTVKDNIEQQMGLMQLQKARQGQMAQQSAMQGANAPMIPQGTPEPEMQPEAEMSMAAGGLTRLPIREMNFGSGGIIAFADGDLVDEAKAAAKAAKEKLYGYGLRQRQQDPEGYAAAQAELAAAEDRVSQSSRQNADLGPAGAMGKNIIPTAVTPQKYSRAPGSVYTLPEGSPVPSIENTYMDKQGGRLARPPGISDEAWRQYVAKNSGTQQTATSAGPGDRMVPRYPSATPPVGNVPPGGIVNVVPPRVTQQNAPAVAPPPVAPVQSDAQKFQSGILAGTGLPTLPPEYAPPKQAPIGEEYTAYMNERLAKRKADEDKFKQRESGRSQRDFFNSLIAAGEATRGQKGIGSLFGGFGKAYSQSATEAEDRQSAFEQKQQELSDNDAKTKFEIANLRRAEERNDSKAVYESKVKLTELGQQRLQLQGQVANQMASNESQERVARANNLTQLEVARINQATAMKPGETERLMSQYGALKAKDPKAAEQFMVDLERIKTGSRGENAQQKLSLQRQALAEKLPIYQMALSSYINETDPAKKAKALTKVREIEGMHGIKSEESSTGSKVIDFSKIP